jgi:hypothetical protein
VRPRQWMAFEEFVQDHGDALVRLSFALCGDRGKAEDATQEALTRVYLRWSRLEDPLPYARRAVVNATRDSWRHQSRRQQREQVVAGYPADLPPAVDDLVADRDRMTRALLRCPTGSARCSCSGTGTSYRSRKPPKRSGTRSAPSRARPTGGSASSVKSSSPIFAPLTRV